jgi:hypothetical protein
VQHLYDQPTNTITFSLSPSSLTLLTPNNSENSNAQNSNMPNLINSSNAKSSASEKPTPKKQKKKGKKKSEDEYSSEEEGEGAKKKKKTPKKAAKETPSKKAKEEDEGAREVYAFPHEKLQINQVKWNPRASGNRWVAYAGNSGLLCLELVDKEKINTTKRS